MLKKLPKTGVLTAAALLAPAACFALTPSEPALPSSLFSFILWFFVIQVLALLSFPLIEKIMPFSPDRGYGLSKVSGIFIFGYAAWILPSLRIMPAGRTTMVLVCLAMLIAHLAFTRSPFDYWSERIGRLKKHILIVELLFCLVFITFTILRALVPEIFWGEKPMDFTLLNFFVRAESLPPEDPWSFGTPMRYYYLGSFFCAAILKLTGIDPAIGYNLAIATLPAIMISALYSVLIALTRVPLLAVCGAAGITLAGNPELLKLVIFDRKKVNFDTFWAATRLFNSSGITEYPIWSFIFADLHAHVIALPFTVLLIGLGTRLPVKCSRITFSVVLHRAVFAVVLGSFFALNSWDFITYSAVTAALILIRPAGREIRTLKEQALYVLKLLAELGLILLTALLAVSPFYFTARPDSGFYWGWNSHGEHNQSSQILRHLGFWFVLAFYGVICGFLFNSRRRRLEFQPGFTKGLLIVSAFLPLIFVVSLETAGISGFSAPIVFLILALLIMNNFYTGPLKNMPAALRTQIVMLFTACFLIIAVESIFLMDRMNTVFKFYNAIWILLALSAVASLKNCFHRKVFRNETAVMLLPSVVFALGLLGTVFNLFVAATFNRTGGPVPTLNGGLYVQTERPDEYKLISWLNSNVNGIPYTAEAQGDSYGPFTRIAMHTGLPTLIGWEHHIKQRGTHHEEVMRRKNDLRNLYSAASAEVAESIINKYGIKLIVVGELERKTYPPFGISKFAERKDIFVELFRSGDTSLYTTHSALMSSAFSRLLKFDWKNTGKTP